VWWTIFTAIDLYIGLIIVDSIAGTLPPEKQRRAAIAKKVILGMLAFTAIVLVVQVAKRY
jgi:hypothetical protein